MSTKTITILPMTEWRFLLEKGGYLEITLTKGVAEIFGRSLVIGKPLELCHTSEWLYIFSPRGATLTANAESFGTEVKLSYPDEGSNDLESSLPRWDKLYRGIRVKYDWPRILVVGGRDAGCSTLARTLAGWFGRDGLPGQFVDLDHKMGRVALPGTFASVPIGPGGVSEAIGAYDWLDGKSMSSDGRRCVVVSSDDLGMLAHRLIPETVTSGIVVDASSYARSFPRLRRGDSRITRYGAATDSQVEAIRDLVKTFAINHVLVVSNDALAAALQGVYRENPNCDRNCDRNRHRTCNRNRPPRHAVISLGASGGAKPRSKEEKVGGVMEEEYIDKEALVWATEVKCGFAAMPYDCMLSVKPAGYDLQYPDGVFLKSNYCKMEYFQAGATICCVDGSGEFGVVNSVLRMKELDRDSDLVTVERLGGVYPSDYDGRVGDQEVTGEELYTLVLENCN